LFLVSKLCQLDEKPIIKQTVFVFIGNGGASSVLIGNRELSVEAFSGFVLFCAPMPALVVLDFDASGVFAGKVIERARNSSPPCPVFIVSAGNGASLETAVILSDDQTLVDLAPRSESIRFEVKSRMFHRSLLALVASTPDDPKLMDIPARMNQKAGWRQGFETTALTSIDECGDMRLRQFFGAEIAPTTEADLHGVLVTFGDILPVRPADGFWDDIDHFIDPEVSNPMMLIDQYVKVAVENGQEIVQSFGQLRWGADLELLRYVTGMEPARPPPPRHVSVVLIVDEMLGDLIGRTTPTDPPSELAEWQTSDDIRPLVKIIKKENGISIRECAEVAFLGPYLRLMTLEEWRTFFLATRETIISRSASLTPR
jgi:hypothetical protein